ncbi:MAG: glycyl radical protein [Moorellaceae bacterium]
MPKSPRVSRLREVLRNRQPELCLERAYWLTDSYRETEGLPAVIRRAKALERVLSKIPIRIEEGELIVGSPTSKLRGGPILPEVNWEWAERQVEAPSSDWDEFAAVPEEEQKKARGIIDYWKGKSLFDRLRASLPESVFEAFCKVALPAGSSLSGMYIGSHVCVDYPLLLSKGLEGIKQEIAGELRGLDLTDPRQISKWHLLKAMNIALEAACHFARRYANLARSLAEKEIDNERASELRRIAEVCERVPAYPARSLHEALQSVWFVYTVLMIEGWGPGLSLGRPDQYLYPYYKRDLEQGIISRDEARELLALFCLKLNQLAVRFAFENVKTAGGLNMLSTIVIGGIDKSGRDAVNELSYLFLEAEEEVGLHAEEFVVRVHRSNPDAFVLRACETAKRLRGKLKFVGDETAVQQLTITGKPLEAARDYIVSGCALPTIPGLAFDVIGSQFNLPLMLELALNNGCMRMSGERIGLETGDPTRFQSFEEVWEAYKRQVEFFLPMLLLVRYVERQLCAEILPTPFLSAFFRACRERGLDITAGGTFPYVTDGVSIVGAPNVADSLAAIKKLVFEDGALSLSRLLEALDRDFEGDGDDEVLALIGRAPKYGNDDDYVDSIMRDIFSHLDGVLRRYEGFAGSKYILSSYVASGNIMLGSVVGALPDGRRAGRPLAEGGLSPHPGRNTNGATATMRSVIKVDVVRLAGGSALNMRFNPGAVEGDSRLRRFAALIRSYFEQGGYHVQFNIVDSKTLRDAQRFPERYRDLLVRVATYSAFFVELGPESQEEIIARTEFLELS